MAWGLTSALTGVSLVFPETVTAASYSDLFAGHDKLCWNRGLSHIHRAS